MFEAEVSREIAVPVDAAWSVLSDWGSITWIPGPEKVEVEAAGSTITRRMFIPGAAPIEETLHGSDPLARRLDYSIAVSELFQLADYRGHITVVPAGDNCRVEWRCSFDQGAMSDEQAAAAANGNLNFLLDSLKAYLEQQ